MRSRASGSVDAEPLAEHCVRARIEREVPLHGVEELAVDVVELGLVGPGTQGGLPRGFPARRLDAALARASTVESAGNNLVADLILRGAPGADAAFSNAGAVRIALPVGPLTYGTVFEMFPFDNAFATLHISAREFAGVIANNLGDDHGILSIAGVRADARCVQGALVVDMLDRSRPAHRA